MSEDLLAYRKYILTESVNGTGLRVDGRPRSSSQTPIWFTRLRLRCRDKIVIAQMSLIAFVDLGECRPSHCHKRKVALLAAFVTTSLLTAAHPSPSASELPLPGCPRPSLLTSD